jgi:predicted N-acetyltransferase YhbS
LAGRLLYGRRNPEEEAGLDDYRFELLSFTPEELERLSALLRSVFTGATYLTPRYLEWIYLANPDGRAVGCNAWHGGELVGHMAAMAMTGRVEGEAMPGLFFLNGAIHPEHRGKKLQSRISGAMFEDAVRQGYRFAVGCGNRYSTGPLLTRFEMVRPLEARIGLGGPRPSAGGFAPSFERAWSDEAIAWRSANPERRYGVRGGRLLAPSGRPGIAAILHESANLPDTPEAPPGPLRVWIGLHPGLDWRGSAFVPIPPRLRPSPLNLVWKDLTGQGLRPDPERFVFRAADFDPF